MPARTGKTSMLPALMRDQAGRNHVGNIMPLMVVSSPSPTVRPAATSASSLIFDRAASDRAQRQARSLLAVDLDRAAIRVERSADNGLEGIGGDIAHQGD